VVLPDLCLAHAGGSKRVRTMKWISGNLVVPMPESLVFPPMGPGRVKRRPPKMGSSLSMGVGRTLSHKRII